MTETGMVERVARAICVAEKMNDDDPLGGWRHWTEAARAAIEAMLSPTRAMVDAGRRGLGPQEFYDRWQAAIDCALSEPSS